MKKLFISFSFVLLSLLLNAQESKRDKIWMLGAAAAPGYPQFGIDFNFGNADTFSLLRPMAFFLTNASICDTNGQLLFYTNGNYVANRLHQMMPGTAGFNPGDENTNTYPYGSGMIQGALIVPWPNKSNLYAILHMSADVFVIGANAYTRALSMRYRIIDMNLDNSLGDFTNQKNEILVLDTLVSGKITACKHANGRDWWILCHELWSDRFYKFILSPDTIQFYQDQQIGSYITHQMDVLGASVFNTNCNQLACLYGDTTLNIFNFDRCTGDLYNPVFVYFSDTLNLATINCAFSASGRYLYVSNNFHIFQLDMQASDIPGSKTIVATYDGFITDQGFRTIFDLMKLAPDNKIYISTYEGSKYFHVINAPDSAGIDCRVTQHSFILPDYNAFSMPNTPNYALGPLTGSICDSLSNGIENVEIKNNSFIIYPNPSVGKISIMLNDNFQFQKAEFQIYNLLGEKVFSYFINNEVDLMDIDVQALSNGMYTCRMILDKNDVVVGKFTIIH